MEKKDKDFLFITNVEAGTYIRKLIHDLGEKIGGAHMLELRRTKAGIFTESSLVNLYDFDKITKFLNSKVELWDAQDAKQTSKQHLDIIKDEEKLRKIIFPAEDAIKQVLPSYELSEKNLKQVLTGKPLTKEDISEEPVRDVFAVFLRERFIGVYKKVEEPGIIAKAEFVFN